MNIGLIGSGGREHAICQKISESKIAGKIYCFPGNAGTSQIAQNIDVDILNFRKLFKLISFYKIKLVIIGPEEPLVKGLVNFLNEKKIKVFGPDRYAAKLEGSKAFMKNLCKKYKIPTASFKVCKNKSQVLTFLKDSKMPLVVKADGLAAGKGVAICSSKQKILKISDEIFKGKFKSSKKIVLEEFLEGEELSYFLVVDKYSFKFFGSAQDHKKVREKEKGPNTGGMGAYSPALLLNKDLEKKIINKIVKPTLFALRKKNSPFKGFLYVGLMVKNNNPYLIEYNVRMGDPECQVILPRLKTDLVKIILSVIKNKLRFTSINWVDKKCMTVVLCSKGYPGKYKKGKKIKNLKKIKLRKNDFIYHAGTKRVNEDLLSDGGRVLNITNIGTSFSKIRERIIKIIKKINWKDGFFRKDIGWRVIERK